jgi:hypothetical protein
MPFGELRRSGWERSEFPDIFYGIGIKQCQVTPSAQPDLHARNKLNKLNEPNKLNKVVVD